MDEQLYLLGIGLSLEDKIEKAIATFRLYEHEALKRDPVNGYYLCDSYGKDSGVILRLAQMSGVRFVAHHNLTTLDPPELLLHGKRHHPETVVHRPEMAMLTMLWKIQRQGPPTRTSRWCCEEYKEGAGKESVRCFGVRAAESARRKANWKVWTPHRQGEGWVLNPILYWTDEDVWRFTRHEKVPYCCLYDEGFTRLGCIGCPMAGDGRRRKFARWPKYEEAWRRAINRFWDNWHGVPLERERWVSMSGKWPLVPLSTERIERRYVEERGREEDGFWTWRRWFDLRGWTSGADVWRWWMEELPEPEDDDCQMGLF